MNYKYFSVDPGNPRRFILFDTTTCDLCGKVVMAPNTIGCLNSQESLEQDHGLVYMDARQYDELDVNDDGDAVCYDCACLDDPDQ